MSARMERFAVAWWAVVLLIWVGCGTAALFFNFEHALDIGMGVLLVSAGAVGLAVLVAAVRGQLP